MKMPLAYAAGIIDGEGTITLSHKKRGAEWRTPVVSVSSTTLEILNAFVDTFGGTICKQKVYKAHYRQSYIWRIKGRQAVAICAQLKRWLLVPEKKRRATIIAAQYLARTQRNGKYTEEQRRRKQQFEQAFFETCSNQMEPAGIEPASRVASA